MIARISSAQRIPNRVALLFLFTFCVASPLNDATSAEILLRNDTILAGGTNNPLVGFIPGEQAASWLTVPSTGTLVGVQVQWDSLIGINPTTLERFVNIYSGGTFPTPGPLLAQVNLPPLSDGSANEFRHLDPTTNLIPMQIPVISGQTIVVALEYLNNTSGGGVPSSVETDADGIQAGKNSIFAIPGGWADAALVGVPGDFGLRAIIQPIPEPTTALLLAMGSTLAICWIRKHSPAVVESCGARNRC